MRIHLLVCAMNLGAALKGCAPRDRGVLADLFRREYARAALDASNNTAHRSVKVEQAHCSAFAVDASVHDSRYTTSAETWNFTVLS